MVRVLKLDALVFNGMGNMDERVLIWITPRPTQPFIPLGSISEYRLRLGRQKQVWCMPFADEGGVCR